MSIVIKKGNTATLKVTVRDESGTLISDLASTTEIYFMLKNNATDLDAEAILSVSKTGGEITVDDPTTGIVKISLTSTVTDITAKQYSAALQLKYAASTQEINLKDSNSNETNKVSIQQDIIRG